MREDIVSFDTAKLAKEKGFGDGADTGVYKNEIFYENYMIFQLTDFSDCIKAPTQALLQKWLREEHNYHIQILCIDRTQYMYQLAEILDNGTTIISCVQHYITYEDALEEALKQTLEII